MASLKRDADMERIAKELREKRGTESLMEKHTKKLKKVINVLVIIRLRLSVNIC